MGFIYKITNQVNGKMYIGKTEDTIEERFKTHCKDYTRRKNEKRPLYDAMKKYGIENFTIEEIEKVDNNILGEREQYWISYYDTYHNGYNATKGGDGRPYADYELIYKLWMEGKNLTQIKDLTKHDKKTIKTALLDKGVTKEEITLRGKQTNSRIKSVYQIDKETNEIIAEYINIAEAEKALNIGYRSKIGEVCNGKQKTCHGYIWRYCEDAGVAEQV